MKLLFYFLIGLLFTVLLTNIYSCFHPQFFWLPFSKYVNIGTPLVVFIYLLLFVVNKKRSNKKLYDHYNQVSSKN